MLDLRRLLGLRERGRVIEGVADSVVALTESGESLLLGLPAAPVWIDSLDLLQHRRRFLVRARSREGVEGVAQAHERLAYLWPLFIERVAPGFVGHDARLIEAIVEAVARHDSNYKLAGVAFWTCVAAAELAVLDLLGKAAGRSVTELLGGTAGVEIPVYLSSLRRETTPEEEVARLAPRLAATGARAVKLKIGGRMGVVDASPGRTTALVDLARRTFGDDVAVMVDANGSYDAEQAIEVGRLLESNGVRYFEEPCAWDNFVATKRVADALDVVQVAGGEQDGSLAKFRWLAEQRGLDIITPDVFACGGLLRTLRIARLATAAGRTVSFHSPRSDFLACTMLHAAAAMQLTAAAVGPHEFLAEEPRRDGWWSPTFDVRDGKVAAPTGPGLGMEIDASELRRARPVRAKRM
jgi:L-alanine-DL-glutamate epimerase-like enolase superfamily enzyme